jgi:hypothetical protein
MVENERQIEEMKRHWSRVSDEELLEIAEKGFVDYTAEAIEVIQTEIQKRGLVEKAIEKEQEGRIDKGWDTDEKFIGWVCSPNLVKGIGRGYAIYATDKRIIGVKKTSEGLGVAFESLVSSITGVDVQGESVKMDTQLPNISEGKIDFEFLRDAVTKIEIKKPSVLLENGYLKVSTQISKPVKVKIMNKDEFKIVKKLMVLFNEEVLEIK